MLQFEPLEEERQGSASTCKNQHSHTITDQHGQTLLKTSTTSYCVVSTRRKGQYSSRGPRIIHYTPEWKCVASKLINRDTRVCLCLYTLNIDVHYLIGSGDFDQCVHLIQAATIFLSRHTAEADSVCIFVGKKFNVAPHRNSVVLSHMEEVRHLYLSFFCIQDCLNTSCLLKMRHS